jgi:hypothetical protein
VDGVAAQQHAQGGGDGDGRQDDEWYWMYHKVASNQLRITN